LNFFSQNVDSRNCHSFFFLICKICKMNAGKIIICFSSHRRSKLQFFLLAFSSIVEIFQCIWVPSEKHVFHLGTKSNIRTSGWKIYPLIFSFKPQISISNLPSVGLKSQSSVWKKKSSCRFFTLGTKLLFRV
jgi:hypothetical protein